MANAQRCKMAKRAYTAAEVAALTGFFLQTITRPFERELRVLILGRPESRHKQRYRSTHTPRAVRGFVIGGLTAKFGDEPMRKVILNVSPSENAR